MLKSSVVVKQSARFFMIVILFLLASPAYLGAEITEEKAIQSAHKAFSGDEPILPEWTFYLDKKLERWHWLKARWQKCSVKEKQMGREDTECGPWLAQMESVTAGKHVWAVVYKRVLAPGEEVLHPNAMVFVDADSGRVLAIITPEGAPLFPK
ncbi:MAG: hypothetical protein E8D48_02475 [Nitrospira sp.]|nr:MAG: hypothetical protein E8D48_02475 [Nitrospira sp.]